jgi:hypothetical protein
VKSAANQVKPCQQVGFRKPLLFCYFTNHPTYPTKRDRNNRKKGPPPAMFSWK